MAKEIVLVKPTWVSGVVKQPETVVSLPDADASYLVSIGRAEFVAESAPQVDAEVKPKNKGKTK